MKIIINASNIKLGGAIQVAASFVKELQNLEFKNEYHIIISSELLYELSDLYDNSKFIFHKIINNPGFSYEGFKANIELNKLEKKINPTCVFSIFSPTYWKPRSVHVSGFAAGWTINPDSIAFKELSLVYFLKKKIENWLKLKISIWSIDIFIGETQVVKERLNKYGKVPLERIYVVGNTFGSHFLEVINPNDFQLPQRNSMDEFRFITISANYPHKNLKVLKKVIPMLKSKKLNVKFFLTIPHFEFTQLFKGYEDSIINLGPISNRNCPAVYQQCDALFLPTLLESFSASYPEAMIMRKPILTSNLDFAKNICMKGAQYFDPLNPNDIVSKISLLINNKERYNELIQLGLQRVQEFPSALDRAKSYIAICENAVMNYNKQYETNYTRP
jgi:glycosyltransferase involved in cell wall biosynthesis